MTPTLVVNAIEARLGVTGGPRQVRDAIESELLDIFGASAAQAAERTETLTAKVVNEINRRRSEKETLGEIAILHLRGMQDEIVYGSSFIFGDEPQEIRQAKLNRTLVDEIYGSLRDLTFGQFEKLGRSILREIGASVARVAPHAGDQGIDFYGELNVGSLLGANPAILRLMHDTKLIVVGQAKHYPDRSISTATVRELVGASLENEHLLS